MQLHIIGTGCPDARAERYGSAFLLDVGPGSVLVDCGPATTYKMARMGLEATQVGHVFLTHHHFDHNADLPCFVLTRWDQSRGTEPPLQLYGPPPTRRFAELLFGEEGAFGPDLKSRVEHPASVLELCDIIDFPGISDPNMPAEVWQRVISKADAVIWCSHAVQA